MQLPKVSIIIPVYNRSEFLADAIDSALNQTLLPFEVIVVDDGSDPAIADRVKDEVEKCSIADRVRLPENRGVSFARNEGLAHAKGEYVIFLDDDDFLEEGLIHAAVTHFLNNDTTDIFIARAKLFSAHHDRRFRRLNRFYQVQQQRYHHLSADHPDYFLKYCPAIHGMVFRKASLPQRPFPEGLRYGEDRWMLMQLRELDRHFQVSEILGAQYTIHLQRASDRAKDRIQFADALLTSKLLRTGRQRSYVHLLKGYFLLSTDKKSALRSILRGLAHPGQAFSLGLTYLRVWF